MRIWFRTHWFGCSLALIAVLSLTIRLLYIDHVVRYQYFGGDPFFYYYWPAVQIASGHGYLDINSLLYGYKLPEANHPPGFVLLVAGIYKLGFHSRMAVSGALAVLGTATVVLVGGLVRSVVSKRAGILAASMTAIYPNIWINDTMLLSETFSVFGLVVALVGIYGFHRHHRWPHLVVGSLGITLAASARPELLMMFPFVVLPLIVMRQQLTWRNRVGLVAVASVLPILAIGSWTAYNRGRFEKLVPLSTGSAQTIQVGACDKTFSGRFIGAYALECSPTYANGQGSPTAPMTTEAERARYREILTAELEAIELGRDMPAAAFPKPTPPLGERKDQSVDNELFMRRTLRYLSAHRQAIPKVVLAREARTVGLWNPKQQNYQDAIEGRGSLALIHGSQIAFWFMSLFAVWGAIVWRRRRIPLYPLLFQVFLTAAVVATTFGLTRYRAPVEVGVVVLAATALDMAITRMRPRSTDPA